MAQIEQHLERLVYVRDIVTQTAVYSFFDGQSLDQSFSIVSGTVAVPYAPYGYDPIGSNAATLQLPRHTSWQVFHVYAPGETWSSLKRDMLLAFGHNRPVLLAKLLPDGTEVIAEARLASFPDNPDAEGQFRVTFTLVFEQREDWKNIDVTSLRYDTGLLYDDGLFYDMQGVQFFFSGLASSFDLINNGNVNEREAIITFDGPITGPITFTNYSCDVRGVPFPPGVSGSPMYLQVLTSLASGEYFTINNRTNEITSNRGGIVPWQQVLKAKGQLTYFELIPGANHCQVAKSDTNAAGDIFLAFNDRYRA